MGQLRDDLRRTTEQYRELNQALAQQQQQMTSLQVSKIRVNEKNTVLIRVMLQFRPHLKFTIIFRYHRKDLIIPRHDRGGCPVENKSMSVYSKKLSIFYGKHGNNVYSAKLGRKCC